MEKACLKKVHDKDSIIKGLYGSSAVFSMLFILLGITTRSLLFEDSKKVY